LSEFSARFDLGDKLAAKRAVVTHDFLFKGLDVECPMTGKAELFLDKLLTVQAMPRHRENRTVAKNKTGSRLGRDRPSAFPSFNDLHCNHAAFDFLNGQNCTSEDMPFVKQGIDFENHAIQVIHADHVQGGVFCRNEFNFCETNRPGDGIEEDLI
jgi:hypothetical protein